MQHPMKQPLLLLLLACAMTSNAFGGPSGELAMQDIQALDKQQAWIELLDAAVRVKPSARTADWTRLVTSAATHVVEQIDRESDSGLRAAAKLIEVVPAAEHNYAFLRTDKGYLAGKAKAVQRVVVMCEAPDVGGCGTLVEALADGIDRFPKGVARSLAFMLSEEKSPPQAIHYWALAADDDQDVCQHGQLERAVMGVLRGSSSSARQLADAQRAAGTCYAALEIGLVRELDAAKDKAPYIANACPVLKTHGTMTVIKKKRCP